MNILMTLIVSLFLGLQCQAGAMLPDGGLEQRLMALLNNDGTVEILDENVPLAGPGAGNTSASLIGSAQTASQSGGASNAPSQPSAVTPQDSQTSPEEQPSEPSDEEQTTNPSDEEQPSEPSEEEQETPVTNLSVAQQLLKQARELLVQYNACTSLDEKKELLGTTNFSVGNDALRSKLLTDNGGSWDQVESEIVDATEYQQGKTLYAQVYMSGSSSDYQPVVYATQNDDLSGNQWFTNMVYDEETSTWMEYVKKHPYNSSRVAYSVTQLSGAGSLDNLEDQFETSELWQPVIVADDADATGETLAEEPAVEETAVTESPAQDSDTAPQVAEQPAQQTSSEADAPAETDGTAPTAE